MKKVIVTASIMLSFVLMFYVFTTNNETSARFQNNLNLKFINTCVTTLGESKSSNEFNLSTEEGLIRSVNVCAKNLLSGGITGDVFLLRKDDMKFLWDNSTDCKPNSSEPMFLTKTSICKLFAQPETCERVVAKMKRNKTNKGESTWYFDNSKELLSCTIINEDIEDYAYVIAQGSQTDEITTKFNGFFLTSILCGMFVILLVTL